MTQLVLGIVFLVLGLAKLRWGVNLARYAWRGDRRGEGRRCVRCEYLMEGLEHAHTCPECAAPLHNPGALGQGRRHRLWYFMSAGFVLSAFGVALSLLGLAGAWQGANDALLSIKPTSWVIRQLDHDVQSGHNPSAPSLELIMRLEADRVAPEHAPALIEAVTPWLHDRIGMTSNSDLLREISAQLRTPGQDLPLGEALFLALTEALIADTTLNIRDLNFEPANYITANPACAERALQVVCARLESARAPGAPLLIQDPLDAALRQHAAMGRLSNEQFTRLIHATIDPKLVLPRGDLRAGDTIFVEVDLGTPSQASTIPSRAACDARLIGTAQSWPSAGQVQQAVPLHRSLHDWSYALDRNGPPKHTLGFWLTLPDAPGEHELEAAIDVRFWELRQPSESPDPASMYPDPMRRGPRDAPRIWLTETCKVTITITESNAPTPQFAQPASTLKPRVQAFATELAQHLRIWNSGDGQLIRVDSTRLTTPTTIAGDLWIIQGQTRHKIGWVYLPKGNPSKIAASAQAPGFEPGACTIEIRPNAGILSTPTNIGPIHAEVIRFEHQIWRPGLTP